MKGNDPPLALPSIQPSCQSPAAISDKQPNNEFAFFIFLGVWELPRSDSKCDKAGRKLRILFWKPNCAAA